ncbi:hypothetical protein C8J57DRAFT_1720216 [Mycena rebaudengoi]|nr:hypothetical protein C8J57DRAFT_1720216 [Mycena rebaudengoi]
MASALRKFGHLGHLKALKTMSLDFTDSWGVGSPNEADWTELDAILSQAVDGLEDIHIHTEQPRDAGLVRSLLPSVGGGDCGACSSTIAFWSIGGTLSWPKILGRGLRLRDHVCTYIDSHPN